MRIAILCNFSSEKKTDRAELVDKLRENSCEVFIGGIKGNTLNDYYKSGTAKFIYINASRNNTNPLKEIASIWSVKNQIKKNKINSVIVYGIKNHAAMVIGSWLGGAKKIISVVNGRGNLFLLNGTKGVLVKLMAFHMLRIAYSLSDSVCFQNRDDADLFIKLKLLRKDKIFITKGSGVNLKKFPFRSLPEENRFLFLSRITPSKGLIEYIQAARQVKKIYSETKFDIVGPLDSTVENEISTEILDTACNENIVNYYGKTDDVPNWMGKCRFFVYPSYYPEGVPRCVVQAAATGRPIITCNTTGCRDTVIEGVNGFLVTPRDSRELAQKMIWLIEHPKEAIKMALASRFLAEEHFDVDKINSLILKKILK